MTLRSQFNCKFDTAHLASELISVVLLPGRQMREEEVPAPLTLSNKRLKNALELKFHAVQTENP
jgi:hypothetical protein